MVTPYQATNVIGYKWDFKTKKNQVGSIEWHKTRLVAKSFHQCFGIDFDDTFTSVA